LSGTAVPGFFVEKTFSEMKFRNAKNLLDSEKRSLSAASKNTGDPDNLFEI